jgi:multidrug resistance efflux pump
MNPLATLRQRLGDARLARQQAETMLAEATAAYEGARAVYRESYGAVAQCDQVDAARSRMEAARLNAIAMRGAERRAHYAICHCTPLRLAAR